MDLTETLSPKIKLLQQQQQLLELDVREVLGDCNQHYRPLEVGEYNIPDRVAPNLTWTLRHGADYGEVQTELDSVLLGEDEIFVIRAWIPMLGNLTIYQHHFAMNSVIDDTVEYTYHYRIANASNPPDARVHLDAAREVQQRFSSVAQVRITSQRRAALRDIATLLRLAAEKKEAQASLQSELDDVHLYCGHTQSGNSADQAISPSSLPPLEITMTTAATIAFVAKAGDKFTATLGTTVLGTSKHADYFEYHLKKGDVKALREAGITDVAYVDDSDNVTKTVSVVKVNAAAAAVAALTVTAPAEVVAVAALTA